MRNGADKVVYPEKQVAKWASIRYTDDHILDYMEVDASHAIFEVEVPEEWVGKTVGELDIRKRYNINILAVKNEGEFGIAISPDTYFEENHKLLVLGEYRALQKCFRYSHLLWRGCYRGEDNGRRNIGSYCILYVWTWILYCK